MYNVLVCDDEKDIVSALQIYLKSEGYQVFSAYNGKEALKIINREDIQLVLMDIMMPVMDGLDAARCIRSLDRSDAKSVPIFAITANAFSDDKERSYKAGMNEHISKPIIKKDLLRIMKKYIPK